MATPIRRDKVTGLEIDHENARNIAEHVQDPQVQLVPMVAEDRSTVTNLAACYLDIASRALPVDPEADARFRRWRAASPPEGEGE